jgi:hypothetical protein
MRHLSPAWRYGIVIVGFATIAIVSNALAALREQPGFFGVGCVANAIAFVAVALDLTRGQKA